MRRADQSFSGVLSVMCAQFCVIYNLKTRRPMLYWAIAPQKNYNWMYPNRKIFVEKSGSHTRKSFNIITTKIRYTCNITHNTESTAA